MLTLEEKLWLREAIFVARNGAPRDLDDALRILNEQIIDDSYPYSLIGAAAIAEAEGRSPGYADAWASLRRVLAYADPIPGDVFTPDPVPPPTSYPTPVITTDEFSAAVLKVLRDNGVFLKGGKVGLGMEPIQDTDARLSIEGGQILGANNGNHQNPVRHENCLDICNSDGGIRFLQYGRYHAGRKIRSTLNRVMSVFAVFDSMGNTCINDEASEPSQAFYIIKEPANKRVILCTFKPGWKIEVRESVNQIGDVERQKL